MKIAGGTGASWELTFSLLQLRRLFKAETLVGNCVPQTLGKEQVCQVADDEFAAAERNCGLFPLVVVVFRSVLTLALQSSNGDSPPVD